MQRNHQAANTDLPLWSIRKYGAGKQLTKRKEWGQGISRCRDPSPQAIQLTVASVIHHTIQVTKSREGLRNHSLRREERAGDELRGDSSLGKASRPKARMGSAEEDKVERGGEGRMQEAEDPD